ncbi:MAG: hypothetical protein HY329_06790 [Chloroflexi bacterium]|nr:hypothetical protein [Chloroflexota bacterium]
MTDDPYVERYGVPRKEVATLLHDVSFGLASSSQNDQHLGTALQTIAFDISLTEGKGIRVRDLVEIMGLAVYDPEKLALPSDSHIREFRPLPPHAYEFGRRFLVECLKEIRTKVCGAGKMSAQSLLTKGGIAGAATWIAAHFGLTDPASIALATTLLLTVTDVTKKSFCRMTDDEVLKAIDEAVKQQGRY